MSTYVNRVELIGNVGQDPNYRTLDSGAEVTKLSIATTKYWKDKEGTQQSETAWHPVTLWSHQAKFAKDYIQKGDLVRVEGELKYDKYQDKKYPDVTHYSHEVVGLKINLLSKSKNSQTNQQNTPSFPRPEDHTYR